MSNKKIQRQFERNLDRIKRKYLTDIGIERFIGTWTFLFIAVTFFFGIRPLYKLINEKRSLIKEMSVVNGNLQTNAETLEKLSRDIEKAGDNLKYIYEYMPKKSEVPGFLVELVSAVSPSGFRLVKYTPYDDERAKSVRIAATLKGNGDFVDLVQFIEAVKRIIKIDSITIVKEESVSQDVPYTVRINMEIYYLGE